MSLIPCTDPCIYQQEGRCTLSRAASGGKPPCNGMCIHFLPTLSQQNRKGLTDVPHRDQT